VGAIPRPLYFEQLGRSGPPFAFVHPNPFDNSCWLYQMAHFSTWFRTIGIDLPGYGRSPATTGELTMREIAGWCWDAVDAVSPSEPAVLCGLSVGFNVVLHMAVLRPERTSAVILSGCSYRTVKEFTQKRVRQYGEQGVAFRAQHAREDYSAAFRDTDLGRYFAGMFVERNRWADAQTIIDMFKALGEPDPDWLFDQPAPVLIVTGSEDNSHPFSFALQERIKGCELVTIEGAGHACNMEQPWEFDRIVLDFLNRHNLVPNAG
jgi:pimeloyl-ACP methyl ester carboxylesterase